MGLLGKLFGKKHLLGIFGCSESPYIAVRCRHMRRF
jgi:hypothetical protein